MSDLTYQHDAIEEMASQLKAFVGEIDAHLASTVEREFNTLLAGGFEGVAADAFRTASAAWNDLVADYQAGLTAFHGKVSSTNQDMRATDQELSKLF